MAAFIIRVELLNAEMEEYARLDAEMQKRDFLKCIPDADGRWYQLPTGEYFYQGHKTTNYICEMGKQAAAELGRKPRILASEVVTVAFDLTPLRKS